MTDEQIIKYWNEIDSEIINEHGEEFDVYITMPVAKSTVDIINRQKAEIERLKEEKQDIKDKYDCQQTVYCDLSDIIKETKYPKSLPFCKICGRMTCNLTIRVTL